MQLHYKGSCARFGDDANPSFLHSRVLEAQAISIERSLLSTWFVFTDRACSQAEKTGSIGGVLVSPGGRWMCFFFFAAVVPQHIPERLFKLSKNPIHELEVLPVLLAAMLWSVYLSKAQTVWYIDNESARMAMIRVAGETEYSSRSISGFVSIECREQFKSWFSRDGASRMECQQLLSLGAVQTTLRWESTDGLLD